MENSSQLVGPSSATEQIDRLKLERDRALEEAVKWRQRYSIEAQQRRTEAELAEKTIRDLRSEVFQLCQLAPSVRPALSPKESGDGASGRLRTELEMLQQERDQLAIALEQEQQRHAKTRESLITALGDVIQRGK
jgi:hypothetical protein